jgi:hypothetical protein
VSKYKWYHFKSGPKPLYDARPTSDSPILGSLVLIFGVGVLAAVGILGWQVYSYLKLGVWQPLSVVTALVWLNDPWARSPTDWLGVHKMLDEMPLSLGAFLAGMAPIGVWLWWDGVEKWWDGSNKSS